MIAASAANQVLWQQASLRHLGRPWTVDEPVWTCELPAPDIWHTAIVLHNDPEAAAAALSEHVERSAYVSVCDTWRNLDLAPLGLVARAAGNWYHRSTATWPAPPTPPGTELRLVDTPELLAAHEAQAATAFEAPSPPARGSVHPPELLDDPDATVAVALADHRVVGAAMSQVGAGVLGVYGVWTLATHRRRGIAGALTALVAGAHPELDTVLQPSPAAASIYRRLGFSRIGSFTHWQRRRIDP